MDIIIKWPLDNAFSSVATGGVEIKKRFYTPRELVTCLFSCCSLRSTLFHPALCHRRLYKQHQWAPLPTSFQLDLAKERSWQEAQGLEDNEVTLFISLAPPKTVYHRSAMVLDWRSQLLSVALSCCYSLQFWTPFSLLAPSSLEVVRSFLWLLALWGSIFPCWFPFTLTILLYIVL